MLLLEAVTDKQTQARRAQMPPAQLGQVAHTLKCYLPRSTKNLREAEAGAYFRPYVR